MTQRQLLVNLILASCATVLGAFLALNVLAGLSVGQWATQHMIVDWALAIAVALVIVADVASLPAIKQGSAIDVNTVWSWLILVMPFLAAVWAFNAHHTDLMRFVLAETLMFIAWVVIGTVVLTIWTQHILGEWGTWIAGRGRILLWTTCIYGLSCLAVDMAVLSPNLTIAYSMAAGALVGLALAAAPRIQDDSVAPPARKWNRLVFDGLSARLSDQLQDIAQIDNKLGLIIALVAIVAAIIFGASPSTEWARLVLGEAIGWPLLLATLVMVRPGSNATVVAIDVLEKGASTSTRTETSTATAAFQSRLITATIDACRRNELLINWKMTSAGAAVVALFLLVTVLMGLRLGQLL